MTGKRVSQYRILEKPGEGGTGVVHKAEDLKLKRTVVLAHPLDMLGNPDRVLTGAHTRLLGVIPLDWVSWRVLSVGSSARGQEPEAGG